jgi:hypothetical protein
MKAVLANLMLGALRDGQPYDPSRYSLYGSGTSGPPLADEAGGDVGIQRPANVRQLPAPEKLPPPLDDDEGEQTGGIGAPQVSQFGCWTLPQMAKVPTGGNQQIVWDRNPTAAKTQIAARQAPAGSESTLAPYDEKTWRTPFEVSQDVVVSGALINTYTGEVAETYEDAMPPPDRTAGELGDLPQEWKNASLRLHAAQGYEPRKLQKREIEQPLPAGDSGPILANATYRQAQEVSLESCERGARDQYFNCNELVPTEPLMTTNPFGFSGFQNMIRINPYLPVTQELDSKDWAPNTDPIPSTARFLETRIRLHRDALAGRTGLAEGGGDLTDHVPMRPPVRASEREEAPEGAGGCRARPEGVFGAAAPTQTSAYEIRSTLRGLGAFEGPTCVQGAESCVVTSSELKAPRKADSGVSVPPTNGGSGALVVPAAATAQGAPLRRLGGEQAGRNSVISAGDAAAELGGQQQDSTKAGGSTHSRVAVTVTPRPASFVASKEECRKTLSLFGARAAVPQQSSTGAAVVAEETRAFKDTADNPQVLKGLVAGDGRAAAARVAAATREGRDGDVTAPLALPASQTGHIGGPAGERVLGDKRGVVPVLHPPTVTRVAQHTVDRPAAPVRGKPRAPEVTVEVRGKPDHLTSQRAFTGSASKPQRERGPTPRRAHPIKERGGLARLCDPLVELD